MSYHSRIHYLDISDLNSRLEELLALQSAVEDAETEVDEAQAKLDECTEEDSDERKELENDLADAESALEEAELNFGASERTELGNLESLRDEIGSKGDLISEDHGPFVRSDSFEDYARELAEETGAIDPRAGWPLTCIDWDKAADELKMDYSAVEWDGDTYYFRS